MDITVTWIRESKQGNVSGLCQPCRRSGLDSIAAPQIIVVDMEEWDLHAWMTLCP